MEDIVYTFRRMTNHNEIHNIPAIAGGMASIQVTFQAGALHITPKLAAQHGVKIEDLVAAIKSTKGNRLVSAPNQEQTKADGEFVKASIAKAKKKVSKIIKGPKTTGDLAR